jgi:hypothetical protein
VLCLVTYTLNGEMRFYCVSDEKCMSHIQMDALRSEFMGLLENQVMHADEAALEAAFAVTGDSR